MATKASDRYQRDPRDRPGTAVVFAVGAHLLFVAVMIASTFLNFGQRPSPKAAGTPAIEATLDFSASDVRAVQNAVQEASHNPPQQSESIAETAPPPPQPLPSKNPQDALVPQQQFAQESIPDPDQIRQDEAKRLAIAEEKAKQEQEAKRRQEQIDLTERKRQEEIEKKRRLAEQQKKEEADRKKKLAAIRAERAKVAEQEKLAEQKLRELTNARFARESQQTEPQTSTASVGQNGADEGLMAKYMSALESAVSNQWNRPSSVPIGTQCTLDITQLPGGDVVEVKVRTGCPMDAAGQRSIEAAVLKAQPLPYQGFETVFARKLALNFTADDR